MVPLALPAVLSFKTQYWTTRGFGVLDLNYRGSTGYGRAYQDELIRQWGIIDVEDAVAGAKYLVRQQKADPQRLAIREVVLEATPRWRLDLRGYV